MQENNNNNLITGTVPWNMHAPTNLCWTQNQFLTFKCDIDLEVWDSKIPMSAGHMLASILLCNYMTLSLIFLKLPMTNFLKAMDKSRIFGQKQIYIPLSSTFKWLGQRNCPKYKRAQPQGRRSQLRQSTRWHWRTVRTRPLGWAVSPYPSRPAKIVPHPQTFSTYL